VNSYPRFLQSRLVSRCQNLLRWSEGFEELDEDEQSAMLKKLHKLHQISKQMAEGTQAGSIMMDSSVTGAGAGAGAGAGGSGNRRLASQEAEILFEETDHTGGGKHIRPGRVAGQTQIDLSKKTPLHTSAPAPGRLPQVCSSTLSLTSMPGTGNKPTQRHTGSIPASPSSHRDVAGAVASHPRLGNGNGNGNSNECSDGTILSRAASTGHLSVSLAPCASPTQGEAEAGLAEDTRGCTDSTPITAYPGADPDVDEDREVMLHRLPSVEEHEHGGHEHDHAHAHGQEHATRSTLSLARAQESGVRRQNGDADGGTENAAPTVTVHLPGEVPKGNEPSNEQ